MSMMICRNGEFVGENDARISPFDRGFLYGDGLFETLRCYGGKFFRLDRHLARMRKGLELLGIPEPPALVNAAEILAQLVAKNSVSNGVARLVVTHGVGQFGLLGRDAREPLFLAACWNQPPPAASRYEKGIRCVIAQQRLVSTGELKSLNYLSQVVARREAEVAGADDAIMLNSHGHVAEATVANLFLVLNREIVTPSLESEILPGITREAVIGLARAQKLPVVERVVHQNDLVHADEMFLTSCFGEVTPVTRLGSHWLSLGQIGPIVKDLMRAYSSLVAREAK